MADTSNFSTTLNGLENSIPSNVKTDIGSIGNFSGSFRGLLNLKDEMQEHLVTYVKAQIPNNPLPTPGEGSPLPDTNLAKETAFASLYTSIASGVDHANNLYDQYTQKLNDFETSIGNSLRASTAAADSITNAASSLSSRQMNLFGGDLIKSAQNSITKTTDLANQKLSMLPKV